MLRTGLPSRRRRSATALVAAAVVSAGASSIALGGPADPDPDFGSGGAVFEPYPTEGAFEDLTIGLDGSIVAVGSGRDGGFSRLALGRYNADGSRDTSFNPTGPTPGTLLNGVDRTTGVDVGRLGDGRIVAVGRSAPATGTEDDLIVERYTTAGSLDPTFNASGPVPGRLITSVVAGADTEPTGALVAPDGTVTVTGTARRVRQADAAFVLRLRPDGARDATFGASAGVVLFTFDNAASEATSIAQDAAGGLAVAGRLTRAGATRTQMGVARLTGSGALVATFNPTGPRPGTAFADLDAGDGRDASSAEDVVLMADGRVVLGGVVDVNAVPGTVALARFTASGVLDGAFGSLGLVRDSAIGSASTPAGLAALDVAADGTVTGAGSATVASSQRLLLTRYTSAGLPDTSFAGGAHFSRLAIGTGGSDAARGIARTPSARIILAGTSANLGAAGRTRQRALLLRVGGTGVPPSAEFDRRHAGAPKPVRPGETVVFTGRGVDPDGAIVRDDWDLDANGSLEATGQTVDATFPAGTATVTHRTTDTDGLTATSTQSFEVVANVPPVARLEPGSILAPRDRVPYPLDAGGSSDPDGNVTRWEFDLDGDGSFETDNGASGTVTHAFPRPGPNTVGVRVTDDEQATATFSRTFDVGASPDFELQAVSGTTPLKVITVLRGETETVDLRILRSNGSQGPVDVTPVLAPSGIAVAVEAGKAPDRPVLELKVPKTQALGDGPLVLRATPTARGAGPAPEQLELVVRVLDRFDLRVTGLEVTQGAQAPLNGGVGVRAEEPYLNPGANFDRDPRPWKFGDNFLLQDLAKGPRTIVRVFVSTPSGPPVTGVSGYLYGTVAGTTMPLPGTVLEADRAVSVRPGPVVATTEEGRSPFGQLVFTMPSSWARDEIDLKVVLTSPQKSLLAGNAVECVTQACKDNNTFRVTGVPFVSVEKVTMATVELRAGTKVVPAEQAFAVARATTPLGGANYDLQPYSASIDVSDIDAVSLEEYRATCPDCNYSAGDYSDYRNGLVYERLGDYVDDATPMLAQAGVDSVVGVNRTQDLARGLSSGPIRKFRESARLNKKAVIPRAVVAVDRALTSVAHEVGHQLGRAHADTDCGGEGDSGEGQAAGDGVDRRRGSDGAGGYQLIFPGFQAVPDAGSKEAESLLFDYMSYCAAISGRNAWIGALGWRKFFTEFRRFGDEFVPGKSAPARRQARGRALTVSGFVTPGGVAEIASIEPSGAGVPPGEPSDLSLAVSGGPGTPTTRVPAAVETLHVDGDRRPRPLRSFRAEVPATARTIDLVDATGKTLTTRSASMTPPKVAILAPSRAGRIGSTGTTVVRARVTDPDAEPARLQAELALVSDGGRSVRTMRSTTFRAGVATFRIANRELPATTSGRLRVTVDDGFAEASADSPRLRIVGSAPRVTITSPRRGGRIGADAITTLEGTAFDDRGVSLPRGSLRWRQGRRVLGSGPQISARDLRPGGGPITLQGRDRLGRTSTASISLRVAKAPPKVVVLDVPERLSSTARRLTFGLATLRPATLVAGRRRSRVGPAARRVTVAVKPGKGELVVRTRLVGPTGSRPLVLRVKR